MKAFARRAGLDATVADGREIVAVLERFLLPILDNLRRGAELILFPGEPVTLRSIERTDGEVRLTLERNE